MNGDIAVAGFMLTAEEWEALDPVSRAQLVAVITRRDDPWIAAADGSGPTHAEPEAPAFPEGTHPGIDLDALDDE